MDNKLFTDLFTKGMNHISTKFDNITLTGDLNYDTLDKTKGATLLDLCDVFDLSNLIKATTCFIKNCVPSLVDVVLTNQPRLWFNALKGVRALRGYFGRLWGQKIKLLFKSFFLLVYKNKSQSVKVWYWFDFYGCYGNKNGLQNRLKIGKWPFWSKLETCNIGINIDHKQIPKKYFNRWWELSRHTIY